MVAGARICTRLSLLTAPQLSDLTWSHITLGALRQGQLLISTFYYSFDIFFDPLLFFCEELL